MSLVSGSKAVTNPGTKVAIGGSDPVASIKVTAQRGKNSANTGKVYIGFNGSGPAEVLNPGDTWSAVFDERNIPRFSDIWIDSDNANDGITYNATNF